MELLRSLLALAFLIPALPAGESSLTSTWQPLDGLGAGNIQIIAVACHDWYGHGSCGTSIDLICAANVPPTNNPAEAKENLNIASACGVKVTCDEADATPVLTLDLTDFKVTERFDHPREDIVRATLECLRRCLTKPLRKLPVQLKANAADQPWAEKIVKAFNAHDRSKVFFKPAR